MRNINQVVLVGNVSHDPQTKETANEQSVTTFGVATHRYFTTKEGEAKSITEFHNVVTWGGIAHRCAETLQKGKLVYIEGYLKTRSFDVGDGKKSFRTEVVAFNMIILSKREAMEKIAEAEAVSLSSEDVTPPAIEEFLDNNTF